MLPTGLPNKLLNLIDGYNPEKYFYYQSNAVIYRLHNDSETLYLKIINPSSHLEQEYKILKWIDGRLSVPKPIYYDRVDLTEYLLTTQINGTPVYQLEENKREKAVCILADALNMIHKLDTDGCPYSHSIDRILLAGYQAYPEKSGLISRLEDIKPEENLTFTHGDYCLPNILVDNGRLGGLIDWDYAGVGDPYRDYVSCITSLQRNFGVKISDDVWIPLFLEELGVKIDEEKLSYFMTLWSEL